MYQPRTYRGWVKDNDLVSFQVAVKETDLLIRARSELKSEALASIQRCRTDLENYIQSHSAFLTALKPLVVEDDAPTIVKEMAEAASEVDVGPMAAVAGAIAERVGKELLPFSDEVIVENGGDIFLTISRERRIGVFAGKSVLTQKIAFVIQSEETPLGVCTSSGTVGHSLSFGRADAVVVFSPSTSLADAAATAICNRVQTASDIQEAIEFARSVKGLRGAAIIKGDKIGLWGQIRLASAD
ncbi:MAG: thiamine biosynthesis protein ApbE [Chloroflexi bacterium RBG_13_52_14]|nr:MAG: thiamine biosynthesis protein ApbE [Chloroflexi bacterium RBG_13_52_14]